MKGIIIQKSREGHMKKVYAIAGVTLLLLIVLGYSVRTNAYFGLSHASDPINTEVLTFSFDLKNSSDEDEISVEKNKRLRYNSVAYIPFKVINNRVKEISGNETDVLLNISYKITVSSPRGKIHFNEDSILPYEGRELTVYSCKDSDIAIIKEQINETNTVSKNLNILKNYKAGIVEDKDNDEVDFIFSYGPEQEVEESNFYIILYQGIINENSNVNDFQVNLKVQVNQKEDYEIINGGDNDEE